MFEKVVKIGFLFDFYGKLLSERQHSVIDLYYMCDLSLSEIGEQLNISRQAVHDALKRGENSLYKYEKKLGLVKKFRDDKKKVKLILDYIEKIENDINESSFSNINKDIDNIRKIAVDILQIDKEVKR